MNLKIKLELTDDIKVLEVEQDVYRRDLQEAYHLINCYKTFIANLNEILNSDHAYEDYEEIFDNYKKSIPDPEIVIDLRKICEENKNPLNINFK